MSSNEQPSTLKSVVDGVTGAAQNIIGSVTGSTADQAQGQAKQNKADSEYDASQATAKGPGFTASSTGEVTKDHPERTTGSWNQTVGSAKETVGNLVGAEGLKQSGREQNLEGQQQEAKGQVKDFTGGLSDRAKGTVGSAVAGITGNRAAQADYEQQHDVGKTKQRGAEHDLQKQAEAEQAARERAARQ
ncbi:hypothetical protein DL769_009061 [Monosporascus sp. CRB-8-3]|nr:hypothetical protein DL769_009061 [Monosporascus sp. CRB-8-3]